MVPVFKNVGERTTVKNYCPANLLFVVSKVFEKLLNNRILDYLENFGLSSDSQHGFRSSRSSTDCLIAASDRIAKTSNRSGG